MNRKNLTAAVLAGLAGAAGIAGTAQAVNINPDGLGQVLIYPYYTANEGNQTILSVVNTTEQAKAVKVRFLEGFNSREVLDFNLYLSEADVWVASLSYQPNSAFPAGWQAMYPDGGTVLQTTDTSCTVPYLYQMGIDAGKMGAFQPFLDIAYVDNGCFDYDGDGDDDACFDFNDAGPDTIKRAAEGHFEIIEMGTIYNDSENGVGEAITHDHSADGDGMPADCALLTELWTDSTDPDNVGQWILDVEDTMGEKGPFVPGVGTTDIMRNSGGLFGGAAVINAEAGSMFSYDAIAIQGFDKFMDGLGLHFEPGTIYPSLNSGDQNWAFLFFGPPTNEPWAGYYEGYDDNYGDYFDTSVDAISALFMKSNVVNEYYVGDALLGATEWVMTFPTKNFYVDADRVLEELLVYLPLDGNDLDTIEVVINDDGDTADVFEYEPAGWDCDAVFHADDTDMENPLGWNPASCSVIVPRDPFTKYFGETQTIVDDIQGDYIAADCEGVSLMVWDREERFPSETPDDPDGEYPPVVSPSLPVCDPSFDPFCPIDVEEVPFQLCNEVNVIRFGDRVIFDTPDFAPEDFDSRDDAADADDWANLNHSLLITADVPYTEGWARVTMDGREDQEGLVGLPVTGFAAQRYSNMYLTDSEGNKVRSTYGGLFRHKGLVTRNASSTDVGFDGFFRPIRIR